MQIPPLTFSTVHDTVQLRTDLTESVAAVRSAITGCTTAELDFRPAVPEDAWTIGEHLAHLADNEARLLVRMRAALGERPDRTYSPVLGGARVQESPAVYAYAYIPAKLSLILLQATRSFVLASLEGLSDSVLDGFAIDYPDFPGTGPDGRMTVRHVLSVMAQHTRHHILYIQRNRQAFAAGAGG